MNNGVWTHFAQSFTHSFLFGLVIVLLFQNGFCENPRASHSKFLAHGAIGLSIRSSPTRLIRLNITRSISCVTR